MARMTRKRYRNLGGDSVINHYAIGNDFIAVQFRDDTVYVYDYDRPGRDHVEQMKACARSGHGLGTYITQHVRHAFARAQQGWRARRRWRLIGG